MHLTLRTLAGLAVASLLAGSGLAHAQQAPASTIPPGWVFQGTFHDGHWDGQWVPGGAPGIMPQGPMPGYAPMADRDSGHMMKRCEHKHGRDHDCERFHHDHDDYAAGYGPPMGAYGQMPYGPAPMGYMMVPVMQPAQPAYTETRTVTTTYVTDRGTTHYHHAVHTHPRDKRVYTGS